MNTPNSSTLQQMFSAWLAERKVIIIDSNAASRNGIAKFMVSLGAKSNHLLLAGDFIQAKEILSSQFPAVIISEYDLVGGNGLALAQEANSTYGDRDKVFVLLTSNSSQSLVAQASEEDVDMFILKPYTIKQFSEIMTKTALTKIYPSDYMRAIEDGKKLLRNAKPDDAIEKFKFANGLSEKPTLALFYRGQAELFKRLLTDAEGSYKEGLQLNDIHYKCLTGLFDLLMSQNKTIDAYSIVKKISSVFPSNPKRLTQIISLSVRTEHYEDIELYYEAFKGIENRNDELTRYICAGLVIAAKHALKQKKTDLALDLLMKASISAAGAANILSEIVITLSEIKKTKEALQVLKRFPSEHADGHNYRVAQFAIQFNEESDPLRILGDLQTLEKQSIKDPYLYHSKIITLKKLNRLDQAREVSIEAQALWPDRVHFFRGAMEE